MNIFHQYFNFLRVAFVVVSAAATVIDIIILINVNVYKNDNTTSKINHKQELQRAATKDNRQGNIIIMRPNLAPESKQKVIMKHLSKKDEHKNI